jgi:hypothetical protein
MSKPYDGLVTGLAKPRQWNEQRKLLRQMELAGRGGRGALLSGRRDCRAGPRA